MATAAIPDALPLARPSARRVLLLGGGALALLASLVLLAPAVGDLARRRGPAGRRRRALAGRRLALELVSFLGHIVLFRAVALDGGSARIGLRASAEITLAGTRRDARCSPAAAPAASR